MAEQVQVAIIGGGIVGCSIAYHLAKAGWSDIRVIERSELTSGSTWHAAGLVGQLRSSRNVTRMLTYSVELYDRLEAETGQATGWKQVGGLRLACSQDRMRELEKSATTARSFGLEMQLLSPQEALELFPIMSLEGVVGAAFLPTDGYGDPSSITQALAKGARDRGVVFQRNNRVTGIQVSDRRASLLHTEQGDIQAEIVVNAAGMWAREIGWMAGVNVPLIPVQHQYMVTEKIPDLPTGLPTMRDPDRRIYYKEETGALAVGGYEPNPIPWSIHGVPEDFGQQLLPSDFPHFEQLAEQAIVRTPLLEEAGMRELLNGPEAFTPDGHFLMGQAPELDNFFVAAGFNAHGIAAAGGVGRVMAEWIIEGAPGFDMWPVDIRRFGPHHRSLRYVEARTLELYGKHYTIAWPHEEHSSARPLRQSPLYDVLAQQGAVYGEKYGWERPNWFAPRGVTPAPHHSFGRPPWFAHVAEECEAIRQRVALIDQSSFSKLEVRGPDALTFLQRVASNNIRKPVGRLTYTQMCNERGGIECDLTVCRFGEELFYITTGTAFGAHDMDWIRRQLRPEERVTLSDVTSAYAVLNLCGPHARDVLASATDDDVSHEAFPFARCRELDIGYARVRALRVTYVGELGWELHIPTEFARCVYHRLWEAGQPYAIANAGYHAIESLRLEKGYRYWSKDITPDEDPYAAGLGFCVSRKKKIRCIGRDALDAIHAAGPTQHLCCFTLDHEIELFGGETICHNGEVLGVVTSGGYGHTLQKTIAYGYLPADHAHHSRYEIIALCKPHGATRHDGALYDPQRTKILR